MASECLWYAGYTAEHTDFESFALCTFQGWLVLRTPQLL